MNEQQKALDAALALIEATNNLAKASAAAAPAEATGHLAEVDATVAQMAPFTPVCTDEEFAKAKANLSMAKIAPEVMETVISAAKQIAARLLV